MRSRLIAGVVAAAVLALAGALLLQQSTTTPEPTAGSKSERAGSPPAPAGKGSASTAGPNAQPDSSQGPPETAVPSPREYDVLEADSTAGDGRSEPLPKSKPLSALVAQPLPATASAVGSIVAGFPDLVIPPAPSSSVETSSVATEGIRLQATLTARTTLTVVELLDFYRTSLAGLSLYDTPAPALDGSSALAFTRGENTVTLTATPTDNGCRYAMIGTFSAAG